MKWSRKTLLAGLALFSMAVAAWIFWGRPDEAVSEVQQPTPVHAKPVEPSIGEEEPQPMSEEKAASIARESLRGHLEVPDDVLPTVRYLEDKGHYEITFPYKRPDLEGWRGPDYYGKVTFDARTVEVILALAPTG